ncbi:Hypothetical protein SRAE_2000451300 [Strongyloides ratti]|uniref:Uncharacterized protein n=1 Tax=Strongyloides ratti TaxID=34506 RepID=A0A090LJ65_STRRB|nr:Hypothetical protein SRAE_2000451300 [Strongyloides ratti]CEF69867.2 Hypothetical protein SRAE_2000451300 [Strongyloides ratti]
MTSLLQLFFIILLSKVVYISCSHGIKCYRDREVCYLWMTSNDIVFKTIVLGFLKPLEALDIEFEVYQWEKLNTKIQSVNAKIRKYVSKKETKMICQILNIKKACSYYETKVLLIPNPNTQSSPE